MGLPNKAVIGWDTMLVIVRDTREQKELSFDGLEGVDKVEDMALPYGDYTAIIDDKPVPIVVERKSLGDCWKTMASDDYDRFKREFERCEKDNFHMILAIEGTYSDVLNGFDYSQFSGESMVKKLATLSVRYGIECWFMESRQMMAHRITQTFLAVARNWKKEKK